MKIIFFGSDHFAAENLQRLLSEGFSVVACVTQPDRPSGRGMKVAYSPIKIIGRDHKIPVLQPDDLKDPQFLEELKNFKADLFIVIAYGKILPEAVLNIPKLFCVNVHGSLLPKYRGAAPVNWAIINGDKETGFTLIKMNNKMDAGEIIVQEKMKIGSEETSQELRERMAKQSAECLCRTVKAIGQGKYSLQAQDKDQVTLAPKMTKEMGRIDWQRSSFQIHDQVRGLLPWPGAYSIYKGKVVKILRTRDLSGASSGPAGSILAIEKQGIGVSTGSGTILITQVQPESGKPMDAYSFAIGHGVQSGSHFE